MVKKFLVLLAVALLPTLSSVAQSESVVALSGNAYVTVASDFFVNLLAEIVKFFKTGEVPFDGKQTLYAIQLRDACVKAIENPGQIINA